MGSARRLLTALAFALSLAACGGDGDDGDTLTEAQATQAFGAMQVALADVAGDISASGSSGNVAVTADCTGGGTASASGQWSTSGQSFSLDLSFDGCAAQNITINGDLSYDGSASSTSTTVSINGRLTFSGAINATCRVDLDMSLTSSSFHISGSLCGVSVDANIQD